MRRNTRLRFRPGLDRLDSRLLPAAGVTASLAQGVLTIQGSEGDDQISVAVRLLSARRGGNSAQVIVKVDGVRHGKFARVRSIVADGAGGADTITIGGAGRRGLPMLLRGGAGDDVIVGGAGPDTIQGGDGHDRLWGRGGQNVLDGGAGLDETDGVAEVPLPLDPRPAQVPAPPPPAVPAVAPLDVSKVREDLITLVNLERRNNGLAPLTANARLMDAAQVHADNMARLDRMEHTLSGSPQPTLQSRADYTGYRYSWLGENIAFNFPDAGTVHFAWMNSKGHRANILNANFTEIGVAVARNARGELYYCQVFGRPG